MVDFKCIIEGTLTGTYNYTAQCKNVRNISQYCIKLQNGKWFTGWEIHIIHNGIFPKIYIITHWTYWMMKYNQMIRRSATIKNFKW